MARKTIPIEEGEESFESAVKAYRSFYQYHEKELEYLDKGLRTKGDNDFCQTLVNDIKKYICKDTYSYSSFFNYFHSTEEKERKQDPKKLDHLFKLISFYQDRVLPSNGLDESIIEINYEGTVSKNDVSRKNKLSTDKFIDRFDETSNFSLFDYIAVLHEFGIKTPMSLIEKICSDEFKSQRLKLLNSNGNDLGIVRTGDEIKGEFYFSLDDKGEERSQVSDKKDLLIFLIIEHCSTKQKSELRVLERLTLKKNYFNLLFKSFDYSIGDLIHSKTFSTPEKRALLYRLMGYFYTSKEDHKSMRRAFKKCISILSKDNLRDSPAFYLDWAYCEKKFGKTKKEIKLYREVLDKFQYPLHKNRSARLYLGVHLMRSKKTDEALSLFSVDDYRIIKEKEFWEKKFKPLLGYYISKSLIDDATLLQKIVYALLSEISSKKKNIYQFIVGYASEVMGNNSTLKARLIRSYFSTDIDYSWELIEKLDSEVSESQQVEELKIDYFKSKNSYEKARDYAFEIVENNSNIDKERIYFKLAGLAVNEKKWYQAVTFFEKTKYENLDSNYKYALALFNLDRKDSKQKALSILNNYFDNSSKSNNQIAISNYVKFCIGAKNPELAGKLITKKLIEASSAKDEQSNNFVSFLYLQQLKLTNKNEHSELIFQEAIKHADSKEQQAWVLRSYAKHIKNNSRLDTDTAIEYLEKSKNLSVDNIAISYEIAECHYYTLKSETCLSSLIEIEEKAKDYLKTRIEYLKIRALSKLNRFDEIKEIIRNSTHVRNIRAANHYLADNDSFSVSERERYFKEVLRLSKDFDYKNKIDYAIFLFETKRFKESKTLKNKVIDGLQNPIQKAKAKNLYNIGISKFLDQPSEEVLNKIESKIKSTFDRNDELKAEILSLSKDFPLNENVLALKFHYYSKLNNFNDLNSTAYGIVSIESKSSISAELLFKASNLNFNAVMKPKKLNLYKHSNFLSNAKKYIEAALEVSVKPKYIEIYALISYKRGDIDGGNKIISFYKAGIRRGEYEKLKARIAKRSKKISYFIWNLKGLDYFSKIHFYRLKEKVAASLIGDKNQLDKSLALQILKSIEIDKSFHKRNDGFLLDNIYSRLAHYFFKIDVDLEEAYKYQKLVYLKRAHNLSFVGAFLQCIDHFTDYKFGVKVCQNLISKNNSPYILRKYGNFLKEDNRYSDSYKAYKDALAIEDSSQYKAYIYNNIIKLCLRCKNRYIRFRTKREMVYIVEDALQKLEYHDPDFEYLDQARQMTKEIIREFT